MVGSETLRRPKFASAMLNHESGSALSKVGSWTEAPNTKAVSMWTYGPGWGWSLSEELIVAIIADAIEDLWMR